MSQIPNGPRAGKLTDCALTGEAIADGEHWTPDERDRLVRNAVESALRLDRSGVEITLAYAAESAIDRAREKWTLDMRNELLRLHAQIAKLEGAAITRP